MLDPKFIRENAEEVKRIINAGRGNPEKANVDKWLQLDAERSDFIVKIGNLRKERNDLSENKGKPDQATIDKVKAIKDEIDAHESKLSEVEAQWQEILDWMPNMPLSDEAMPDGKGEEDNPIIKAWKPDGGYIEENKLGTALPKVDYMDDRSMHWDDALQTPKHHIDLGKDLGIIDNEQSAKTSGSRFTYLLGDAVLLQFALQQFIFNELLTRGFKPLIPPTLVRDKVLYGTSHFPEHVDQVYGIETTNVEENQKLYLLGSSESANFAYFMDKTLEEKDLPVKVFAYTTCFRSEVGSWGKDVRGIKRVHQFDKIEINAITLPEQSTAMFDEFLSINEWLLQSLKIPYRLALKCKRDGGYQASAKQVDPEGWLPGQQEFIELGTDTNTTDFQARRLNIRVKRKSGEKEYVHTVNDTGIAMGRMIIAILDNYQQSDGSVVVPEVLRKYIGKDKITKA
jgi:seryl-tRNA synthetase